MRRITLAALAAFATASGIFMGVGLSDDAPPPLTYEVADEGAATVEPAAAPVSERTASGPQIALDTTDTPADPLAAVDRDPERPLVLPGELPRLRQDPEAFAVRTHEVGPSAAEQQARALVERVAQDIERFVVEARQSTNHAEAIALFQAKFQKQAEQIQAEAERITRDLSPQEREAVERHAKARLQPLIEPLMAAMSAAHSESPPPDLHNPQVEEALVY